MRPGRALTLMTSQPSTADPAASPPIDAERTRPTALEPLLTVHEVAAFLNISTTTVRRLVANREIPSLRIGCQLRFDRGHVLRWTSARKEG